MVSFSFCLASVRENNWKNVCWKTALFSLSSAHAYNKGGGKYSYYVLVILFIYFYVATFFPWYPQLIIRYSNMYR